MHQCRTHARASDLLRRCRIATASMTSPTVEDNLDTRPGLALRICTVGRSAEWSRTLHRTVRHPAAACRQANPSSD